MSDGSSKLGNISEMIGEVIAKPVSDEVGQAIETASQSLTGKYQDPSQKKKGDDNAPKDPDLDPQKIAQEEQRKKQNVLRFLEQLKQQEQQSLHQKKMQEMQKNQEKVQEEQQDKQVETFQKQKKDEDIQQQRNQSKAERRLGVGG